MKQQYSIFRQFKILLKILHAGAECSRSMFFIKNRDTHMKNFASLFALLTLAFNTVSAQTLFGWEAAVASGDATTETIDGITTTLTNDNVGAGIAIPTNWGGWQGSSGNVVSTGSTTSVTFTFSEAVDVHSILPMDASSATIDYTLTPSGGSNSPVVVSLTSGGAPGLVPVELNWTNVTSFTVTAPSLSNMAFDLLSMSMASPLPAIVFGWETAVASGDATTETIDGITTTLTNDNVGAGIAIPTNWGGWQGSSGNVVSTGSTTSVTFTFSEAVDVHSILPMDASSATIDYTLTPSGGSNSPVVVSLTSGGAPGLVPVELNWTNVTSFTVTASSLSNMAFDLLSVNVARLSNPEIFNNQRISVYPNPVKNILYIKNASGLNYINVYDSLGQKVLRSNHKYIDVSNLSKGMYFLEIHTTNSRIETKRIIKR